MTDITEVVLEPDVWLDTPNDRLGGQPPRALLQTATGREILYSLVQSVKYGMIT
ncbi:MAG TPA: antitoxin Xre/MbcA/ParS toxin-binding domain-containing protein [Thermoanaerobaculia bacterium]|nr:antitoxin Xre/MbcA/ParS toxin-binding domain-containing protein [Thermoanaerobaculia bacterium]